MSTKSASTGPPPVPMPDGLGEASGELNDFSYGLSPMLVKELRQGLRSKIFAIAFILLQAGLIIFTLFASADRGSDASGGIFWFIVCAAMLVVMPLRATEALGGEILTKTMELLFLTKLSAFRIAFGKWVALFSQTLLLTVSVLPYLILRYYLGGVDILHELGTLFLVVLVSAVLQAAVLGFSSTTHSMVRLFRLLAAVVGGCITMGWFMALILGGMFSGGSMWSSMTISPWLFLAGCVIYAAYFIYYFIDMGASRIAPLGSNHSTRKRLLGLAALLVTAVLTYFGMPWEAGFTLGCFIMLPLAVEALTEYPTLTRGIVRPFVNWKLPTFSRLGTHFLTPGWHTGFLYVVVLLGLTVLYLYLTAHTTFSDKSDLWCPILVGIAALIFPVAIIRLFFRNAPNTFLFYFVIQIAMCVVWVLLQFVRESGMVNSNWVYPVSGAFPLAGFFMGMDRNGYWEEIATVSGIVLAISVLIIFGMSLGLHSRMSKLFGILAKKQNPYEAGEGLEYEEEEEASA